MPIPFHSYEVPVLRALDQLGGSGAPHDVYAVIADIMKGAFEECPEELGAYPKSNESIWKNKVRWAREWLKRRGQLDGSVPGMWRLTSQGEERLRLLTVSGTDIDEGLALVQGGGEDVVPGEDPVKYFDRIGSPHEHGDILDFRGIVYDPINEAGAILVFVTLCMDLGFRIEAIRGQFPDALLGRKTVKGTFKTWRVEFEYLASNFKKHDHPVSGCDLIICWKNDWPNCPIEVIDLSEEVKKIKKSEAAAGA